MLDRYPQLYKLGQSNAFFTKSAFWQWIGNAFYHSIVRLAGLLKSNSAPQSLTWLVCQSSFCSSFRSSCFGWVSSKAMGKTRATGSGEPRCTSWFCSRYWVKLLWSLSESKCLQSTRKHVLIFIWAGTTSVWTKYTLAGKHDTLSL